MSLKMNGTGENSVDTHSYWHIFYYFYLFAVKYPIILKC